MRQSPGGLVLGNLVISGLYEAGKVFHNPVTVALRKLDVDFGKGFSILRLLFDGTVQVDQKLALPLENLDSACIAVAGQDSRAAGARIAFARTRGQLAIFASHSLLRGPLTAASPVQRMRSLGSQTIAVRGGVSPAEVEEIDLAGCIFQDEGRFAEGFLRALDIVLVQIADIGAFASAACQRAGS